MSLRQIAVSYRSNHNALSGIFILIFNLRPLVRA